jgi:hypothetical protein
VQAVAAFKIAHGAASPHAAPAAAPQAAPKGWNSVDERRGKDRATNVTRPKFGKTAAAAKPAPAATAQATGSDDWTSF